MAMTLIEAAKSVRDPKLAGFIETLYIEEPTMQYVPFRTVAGLSLSYNQEAELPAVGFRNINEAFSESTGVLQPAIEVLKPFGGDSDTDIVLVDAYGAGIRGTYDGMFAKSMSIKYVQFLLYGNSPVVAASAPAGRAGAVYDDVKGFDGMLKRIQTAQTVDGLATGGTDGSSVFALRFGEGYVQGLMTPKGISTRDLGEVQAKPVFRTRVDAVMGLAIFNGKSVAMLKDLAAATQLCTCVLMDQLTDKIQGRPTIYLASKRSRYQLKQDAIGKGVALSMTIDELGNPVESWGGRPFIVSEAVIDTEHNT